MLTIAPVENIDYYADLAKEDYYLGSGEPPGIWRGLGARQLGICNQMVQAQDYNNLMNGLSPEGAQLTQNSNQKSRRHAWDCTFSCPKSVSLLAAAGDAGLKKAILSAQDKAVSKAIEFIERKAAYTRRGKSGVVKEKTAGLVVATFQHSSSRELQPQIHTHALICNTAPRHDQSWGSIDSQLIYDWQLASGAIYRAELAYHIRQLGFSVALDDDSFHINGVDKKLCNEYSKRANDIEEELKKEGIKTSASKSGQKVKLLTRKHKKAVNHVELYKSWKCELAEKGLDENKILQLQCNRELDKKSSLLNTYKVLDEITENRALFTEQYLYKQVAIEAINAGVGAKYAESFALDLLESSEVIALSQDKLRFNHYTTPEVVGVEQLMIRTAKDLASKSKKRVSEKNTFESISSAERQIRCMTESNPQQFMFDDEQREAIFSMLNGNDFAITQGSAGAGKTTTLLPVKLAYEKKGLKIEGACIAKKAADNLQAETGIKSQTVASIVSAIQKGKRPLKKIDVLVVDEAGQLPSTDLQILLTAADKGQCKLILTGEDKQLDSINRGGALRYLSRPEVIGAHRIENIRRQRQSWARTAVANLRDGKSHDALISLNSHKCLHWGSNHKETKEKLIADWKEYRRSNPDKKTLVIAHRWSDVKELSQTMRDVLIEEGVVQRQNIAINCSVSDKQFDYQYSIGDRVKFTRNEYRKLGVSNGTLGTISDIAKFNNDVRLSVLTDDGRNLSFLASEYADELGTNLCLAYALTVYSSQGTTIDGDTFSLYTGRMDRANSYVSLSRHKDNSHLYVNTLEIEEKVAGFDDKAEITDQMRINTLANMMSRDDYATLAVEHLPSSQRAMQNDIELEPSL